MRNARAAGSGPTPVVRAKAAAGRHRELSRAETLARRLKTLCKAAGLQDHEVSFSSANDLRVPITFTVVGTIAPAASCQRSTKAAAKGPLGADKDDALKSTITAVNQHIHSKEFTSGLSRDLQRQPLIWIARHDQEARLAEGLGHHRFVEKCACDAGKIACKSCEGGKHPCGNCEGTTKVRCSRCRGTSRIDCTSCGGDGKVTCSGCNGHGHVSVEVTENGWTVRRETKSCGRCGGSGRVAFCPWCVLGGGKIPCDNYACSQGEVDCTACDKHGQVQCSTCSGRGYNTCASCRGEGEFVHQAAGAVVARCKVSISVKAPTSIAQFVQTSLSAARLDKSIHPKCVSSALNGQRFEAVYEGTVPYTSLTVTARGKPFTSQWVGSDVSTATCAPLIDASLWPGLKRLRMSEAFNPDVFASILKTCPAARELCHAAGDVAAIAAVQRKYAPALTLPVAREFCEHIAGLGDSIERGIRWKLGACFVGASASVGPLLSAIGFLPWLVSTGPPSYAVSIGWFVLYALIAGTWVLLQKKYVSAYVYDLMGYSASRTLRPAPGDWAAIAAGAVCWMLPVIWLWWHDGAGLLGRIAGH